MRKKTGSAADPGGGGAASRRALSAWLPVILLEAGVLFLSSRPGLAVPAPFPHLDKAAHLFEYALLGGLIHRGWRVSGRPRGWTWGVSIALLALLAAGDERMQAWVPGRDSSPADWVADLMGGIVGNWVASLWYDRRGAGALAAAEPRREG